MSPECAETEKKKRNPEENPTSLFIAGNLNLLTSSDPQRINFN